MSRIGRALRTSGQHVEVVRLRRREREPLERLAAPGVVPGPGAAVAAEDRVDERQHDARPRARTRRSRRSGCRRRRRCRRRTCRRRRPGPRSAPARKSGTKASRSAERDRPEGDPSQHLAHRPPGHLREPVVKGGEAAEDGAADQREVGGRGGVGGVLQRQAAATIECVDLGAEADRDRRDRAGGEEQRRPHPQRARRPSSRSG